MFLGMRTEGVILGVDKVKGRIDFKNEIIGRIVI